MTHKINLIFIVPTLLLMLLSVAPAAEYHISPLGDDSTERDGSLANPWRTPQYGANRLSTGDTLYLHAGTYRVTGGTSWGAPAIEAEADGVTITNYGDDLVIIDGGTFPTGIVIGVNGFNNQTIKGLTIKGCVGITATAGFVIEDCDISVGGDNVPGTMFGEAIFLQNTTNVTIRNNKLHDNFPTTAGYGGRLNSPLIQEYDSTNLVIENNEIFNSCGTGVRLKDDPETVIVRNNYFHDNYYSGVKGANQDQGHDISIYQNIFRNNNTSNSDEHGGVGVCIYMSGVSIFNNTFINNKFADIMIIGNTGTRDIQIWNNISYSPKNKHICIQFSTYASNITYCNYNLFFNDLTWEHENSDVYTLSAWQAAGSSFDINSFTDDPKFVNPAGVKPEDFKLAPDSPCVGAGRSGQTIGAFITGNETIGPSDQGDPPGSAPGVPPDFAQLQ